MSGYPRDWKAFTYDYGKLLAYTDEDCNICLTQRQIAIIQGALSPLYWDTRWENLPTSIKLQNLIGDIEGKLMACLTGCDCGCGGSTIEVNTYTTEVNTSTTTSVTTYITSPGTFLPDVQFPSPGVEQESVDAALCTALQLLVSSAIKVMQEGLNNEADRDCGTSDQIFDIGQAVLNEINGQATNAAWITAGASIFNPAFAVVSAAATFAAGASDLASSFLDVVRPDCDDSGSFPPVPSDQVEAMACCLWGDLKGSGFTYDAWLAALDNLTPPCTKVDTDQWPGGSLLGATVYNFFATALETQWANLETYVNVAQMVQTVLEAIGGIVPAPCPCAPACSPTSPSVVVNLFDGVNGPQAGVIMSPRPVYGSGGYVWEEAEFAAGVIITVPFRRCVFALDCTIGRSAGSDVPKSFEMTIGGQKFTGTLGPFGPEPLNISVSPSVRSTTFLLTFAPGSPRDDVTMGSDLQLTISAE